MLEELLGRWDGQLAILGTVCVAMVLGGIIGLDRELEKKPAGLRTHMFVAGASAMLVGLSDVLLDRFTIQDYNEFLRTDPIRIVEAIITGISFLGAGTIFRAGDGEGIEGLTTAASILICCAIGISAALEQWLLAVGVTIFSILILRGAAWFEYKIAHRQ